jgi:hypothetical protein
MTPSTCTPAAATSACAYCGRVTGGRGRGSGGTVQTSPALAVEGRILCSAAGCCARAGLQHASRSSAGPRGRGRRAFGGVQQGVGLAHVLHQHGGCICARVLSAEQGASGENTRRKAASRGLNASSGLRGRGPVRRCSTADAIDASACDYPHQSSATSERTIRHVAIERVDCC